MNISKEKKPKAITIANTDTCQSRCVTCNGWRDYDLKKQEELSLEQWKNIFKKMHDWLGNYNFIFSGGEPFMRDDIFEMIEFASSLGDNVNIITNGLGLKNKCEKLINSSICAITISLNSVKDPAIHKASRGLENSFKRTIDVIQTLTYLNRKYQKGKTIGISTILMPSNLSEVKPLAEFAKTEGVGISFQLLDDGSAFMAPDNYEDENSKYFGNITQKAIEAINLIGELKKEGYPIYNSIEQLEAFKKLITDPSEVNELVCKVGDRNFAISARGEARICFCMESIGSLIDSTPQEVWEGKKAQKVREEILKCSKNCKLLNCNFEG